MEVIRSISPKCPIYAWQSGSTSAILFLFGPEYLGGTGDLAAKIAAIETDDEKERYEALLSFCDRWKQDRMFAAYGAWIRMVLNQHELPS